jgi:antitoxin (DNA-binding transcriptional repressor) of toxin-antitoxin stability system
MKTITATELARNLRQVLDSMLVDREEIEIERNHVRVAKLVPGPGRQTAMEALTDLYRTLPEDAARGWSEEARTEIGGTADELRDPWHS